MMTVSHTVRQGILEVLYLALFCAALYGVALGSRAAGDAYCKSARADFLQECNAHHATDCAADFELARPYCRGR